MTSRRCVCSWSGGKESYLALERAFASGLEPAALLTMLVEEGGRTRSHGLRVELVEAQAAALGLPLIVRCASWDGYEDAFRDGLAEASACGLDAAVFGDIDVDDHRRWVERVSAGAGLDAVLPLWQERRGDLLDALLALGVEARLVAARDGQVPADLLGRALDRRLADELSTLGIDPCGEAGEYHTAVVGGPRFSGSLAVRPGEIVLRDGVWFLDLAISEA